MKLNEIELHNLVNYLSVKYFDKPYNDTVMFNNRLRTTGGRYIPSKRLIELNPKYVLEMDEAEFHGIIKHELCHYHLHIEGRGYKHSDASFKELLKATGSPRHCKPLPSNKSTYKYLYICRNCNYYYKRMRRVNVKKLRCGKCHGTISLVEKI